MLLSYRSLILPAYPRECGINFGAGHICGLCMCLGKTLPLLFYPVLPDSLKVCCQEEPDYQTNFFSMKRLNLMNKKCWWHENLQNIFFLNFLEGLSFRVKRNKMKQREGARVGEGVNHWRQRLICLLDFSLWSISINGQGTSQCFYTCYV